MNEHPPRSWTRHAAWAAPCALALLVFLALHSEGLSIEQAPDPAGAVFAADDQLSQSDADTITFSRDIAPILQENCQLCHQPGAIAPMSFMTYDEVRPWGPIIQREVVRRNMPPYHYDTDVGIQELQHDRRLSDEDIETIVRWVRAGMPEGDPADLPEPVEWPDPAEWRLAEEFGPPDHVIPSDPYTVPARGQDIWWQPMVESGITENRCIRAIEVKPSLAGRAATHHANSTFHVQNEDGEWVRSARLTEYALGKLGEVVPEDACRIAPADSRVVWDIHYYPSGDMIEDDVVEIGLWFHPDEVADQLEYDQTLTLYYLDAGDPNLRDYYIPPHETLMTQGMYSFDHPVRIDSFQPHGHLRLTAKKLEIYHPDTGERELVSQVSNWNPGWHLSHMYEPHAAPLMPAGSIMIITAWYDNTAANPWNPDPDQWVGPGDRTTDEMSHAWIAITHLDEEGFETLVAEREERERQFTEASDDQ